MKKWTEILFVVVFTVTSLLGGCGDNKKGKEFTVAAIVPKTGPIGYLGEQELAGLELAAEDINSKGGISGRMVRIKWEDTGGDVSKAVTAANKLLLDGNVDMLFVTTTGAVKAIAPIAEAKRIPLIAMAADTGITNLNKYLFRMYMNFDDEQRTLASYIGERGLKRVVLLRPEDEAFKNSQQSLEKHLQPSGISIAGAETFTRQTKDYRVQIEKLLRVAPDSIVVLGYGPDFPSIVEQIKQNPLSKSVAILGGYGLISRAAQQNGTDIFKELPFVSFAAISSPELQKFSSRVTARLGRPAGQFLDYLYAYDSLMFIASLGVAGDSGKLLAAIEESKGYEGIGGTYKFNNARDASVPLAVAQFFDSEAKIVWAPPK